MILLIIVGVVLLWLLADILLSGGSMTGGMTPAPRSGRALAGAARWGGRPASGAGVGGMMMVASNLSGRSSCFYCWL